MCYTPNSNKKPIQFQDGEEEHQFHPSNLMFIAAPVMVDGSGQPAFAIAVCGDGPKWAVTEVL